VSNHELSAFLGQWLPRLESEMRAMLDHPESTVAPHYGMMEYHLGWRNEWLQPQLSPAGKRLRPILCLLACAEVGGEPVQALPAAAAIELLHNFSLIHDDIEDGDELRRHRPTVWKIWGIPLAINAGDGLFAIAFAAVQRLSRRGVAAETVLQALDLFTQSCLALTEGQYLDISFEQRSDVIVADYLRMIQGKTAALIGASVAIGAQIGGATAPQVAAIRYFGQNIGLAFQIQDDLLGIWGDPEVTGKAAGNDILRRKKSLPILHALTHERVGGQFSALLASHLQPAQLDHALVLLEQAETRTFVESHIHSYQTQGLAALQEALGPDYTTSSLYSLAESLLHRNR
jgi:geranylgeranyl diphosphate synthase type I